MCVKWWNSWQKCRKLFSMRKTELKEGEFYHVYNRGVDKREVFLDENDYIRFLVSMKEFNQVGVIGSLYEKNFRDRPKEAGNKDIECPIGHSMSNALVEFMAYCLNDNHFHFILRQVYDQGIQKFMQKLGNAYTKYFNYKYKRSGVLFQGPFKSVHIESNEKLCYLSAYVNTNHFIHGYGNNPWKYSSLLDYAGKRNGKLCSKDVILNQFDNNVEHYREFLEANALDLKEKKGLEKYRLEE